MRHFLLAIIVLGSATGCTSVQLRTSTVKQASTLSELQRRQVLNNLAVIACNRSAIPFHVNLRDGSTQVSDNGSLLGQVISSSSLTLGLQRTLVDQWSMAPVTDDTTLKLLQVAYRRALGETVDLYTVEGLANDLAHELKKQTAVVDDIRTLNASGSNRTFRDDSNKADDRVEPPKYDGGFTYAEITRGLKLNESIISSNSDEIVQKDEFLTEANLVFPPAMDSTTHKPRFHLDGSDTYPLYKKTTPLVAELRRLVKDVNDDLIKIRPGSVKSGCKADVPKEACYVACHKDCGRECYVWICPEDSGAFEDFTLKILKLSSLLKESQVLSVPGVRYSPSTNNSSPRIR